VNEVSLIGIDLAKARVPLHGAATDGGVVFCKKLRREQLLAFLAGQPRCTVAMEACAAAHHWGRMILGLGHAVRLIPPVYVKPFVKRQKNDAAEAEADRRGRVAPIEDGLARHPPIVDLGGDGGCRLGGAPRRQAGLLARAHAGEESAHAGGDRARQPDGARGLGDAYEGRGLPDPLAAA